MPNPGFTASTTDPTLINFNFNNLNREDNALIKLDYHPTSTTPLAGDTCMPTAFRPKKIRLRLRPDFLSQADTKLGVMGVNWTYAPNSRWVNEARFGFNRNWQKLYPVDHTLIR